MQTTLVQTRSHISASYTTMRGDNVQYTAEIPLNQINLCSSVALYENGLFLYSLRFDHKESLKNPGRTHPAINRAPFQLLNEHGETVGHIYVKRTGAFFGYRYFNFLYLGLPYTIYEVGLGKQGIKIPIYHNQHQIALIEKDPVVYDNKDVYSIISTDAFAQRLAVVFAIYYDFVRFGNHGQYAYHSKKAQHLHSMNKTIKSKYDPAFALQYR